MAQDKSEPETTSGKIISRLFLSVLILVMALAVVSLLLVTAWITIINPKHKEASKVIKGPPRFALKLVRSTDYRSRIEARDVEVVMASLL
jgi:hypothetical protein